MNKRFCFISVVFAFSFFEPLSYAKPPTVSKILICVASLLSGVTDSHTLRGAGLEGSRSSEASDEVNSASRGTPISEGWTTTSSEGWVKSWNESEYLSLPASRCIQIHVEPFLVDPTLAPAFAEVPCCKMECRGPKLQDGTCDSFEVSNCPSDALFPEHSRIGVFNFTDWSLSVVPVDTFDGKSLRTGEILSTPHMDLKESETQLQSGTHSDFRRIRTPLPFVQVKLKNGSIFVIPPGVLITTSDARGDCSHSEWKAAGELNRSSLICMEEEANPIASLNVKMVAGSVLVKSSKTDATLMLFLEGNVTNRVQFEKNTDSLSIGGPFLRLPN